MRGVVCDALESGWRRFLRRTFWLEEEVGVWFSRRVWVGERKRGSEEVGWYDGGG